MNKILISFIAVIIFCYSCKKYSSLNKLDSVHFVIIETNVNECDVLQKKIKNFKPTNIKLPTEIDITGGEVRKPTYWYSTGEGKPARAGIYNSPEDTIGKQILSFVENKFVLPKSGLDSTVNLFGGHYSLLIKQFVNRDEAVLYIQALIDIGYINKETIVFPISLNELDTLDKNFDSYSSGFK